MYPVRPGPGKGRVVVLQLPEGHSLGALASQLHHAKLVRERWLFHAYALAMGAPPHLRTGLVRVRDDMPPRALLQRVAEGYGQASLRVTLPEGFNQFDMARRLAQWDVVAEEEFLTAVHDPEILAKLGLPVDTGSGPMGQALAGDAAERPTFQEESSARTAGREEPAPSAIVASAEGYLFPDTYHFLDHSSAEVVLERLVRTSQRRVERVIAEAEASGGSPALALGLSPAEIVTLASIVEKEAAVADEQPIIAGVFLNRLRDPNFKPKRLQADPTVAYGCLLMHELDSCRNFDGRRVTRRMTADANNLYNTYRHEGLPPGPISNPGLSAVRAVLHPTKHDYLYFVARGQGRHRFSTTLQEHNAAVEAVRRLQ